MITFRPFFFWSNRKIFVTIFIIFSDINDFILLDWAQFMMGSVSNSDELAFKVLVRKLTEFGVLFK